MSKTPPFSLQPHPSTSHLSVSAKQYLSQCQADSPPNLLLTGAVVFSTNGPTRRILLLQRASSDSMPNLWETPGGACDDEDDATIIHAVARELWEETGLLARSVGPLIGSGYSFRTRGGRGVLKLTFVVDVEEGDVRLAPEEHRAFAWATEEQVKARMVDGLAIEFTAVEQEKVILDAFEATRDAGPKP